MYDVSRNKSYDYEKIQYVQIMGRSIKLFSMLNDFDHLIVYLLLIKGP
jgi:hypothetical protein